MFFSRNSIWLWANRNLYYKRHHCKGDFVRYEVPEAFAVHKINMLKNMFKGKKRLAMIVPGELQIIRNAQFAMRNAQCGIRNAEFGIRNSEFGIRNAEFGIILSNERNVRLLGALRMPWDKILHPFFDFVGADARKQEKSAQARTRYVTGRFFCS